MNPGLWTGPLQKLLRLGLLHLFCLMNNRAIYTGNEPYVWPSFFWSLLTTCSLACSMRTQSFFFLFSLGLGFASLFCFFFACGLLSSHLLSHGHKTNLWVSRVCGPKVAEIGDWLSRRFFLKFLLDIYFVVNVWLSTRP